MAIDEKVQEVVEEYVGEFAADAVAPADMTSGYLPGHFTALKVAYPLIRDNFLIPAGSTIKVEAMYNKELRRWVGPEGSHVEQLFDLGMIFGSKQHLERERKQAAVDAARKIGVVTEEAPDGNVSLKQTDNEKARKDWASVPLGNPDELIRQERQASGEDIGDRRVYAGAKKPGSRRRAPRVVVAAGG